MTDKEVEDIIRSNMNLQMNLAGIRQDFEEKLQRTWVELTDDEVNKLVDDEDWYNDPHKFARIVETKIKQRNT